MKQMKCKNIYNKPFPKDTVVKDVVRDNPAHTGPFVGALDFSVILGTPVLVPLDGEIVEVVDIHEKYGPSPLFAKHLNYITIKHSHGEYSQLAHLAKKSSLVKVGDKVREGQEIAVTGNSGWMTEPHLHMIVFKLTKNKVGFQGLETRFKNSS